MLKDAIAWLVLSGAFVLVNVAAAGALLGAFKAAEWVHPELVRNAWATYPLGIAVTALVVCGWCVAMRAIARLLSQGPARGRG